ncbi:MAG: energy-coupling factor ABC transporter permease [Treponemataceae bacterium]|nr:MAG: energy-coupling factor ABC transporter permease [Treponemataceae bacterium]
MHMADALLSPAVGGTMWAASAVSLGFAVKKAGADDKKIPLMGIMGAFVFAGQMINFTIPGTGSSGHIGGGILLAALLGPWPALITLASVLIIQCLFFADGGLLAYGCNVFNMGACSALIAYPLIFKPLIKKSLNAKTITLASILAVVVGLQIGAFFVVLETLASGITELPFGIFAALMQPIHLAIGLVEGIVTAAVLCFVHLMRPEIMASAATESAVPISVSTKKVMVTFAALTLVVAGLLSLFASAYPDGLEWSMEGTAGTAELEREGAVYDAAGKIVGTTAFMPDYAFKENESAAGTSVAGIVGSVITVALAGGIGLLVRGARKASRKKTSAARA